MSLFAYRYDGDCFYIPQGESGGHNVSGPGFWMTLGIVWERGGTRQAAYDEVETALSREEFGKMLEEGATGDIIYALSSDEAQAFADRIREEELYAIADTCHISESEARYIVDMYPEHTGLDYWDRAIVGACFSNWQEAAEEKAWSWGLVENGNDRYFDYDAFIEDLREDEDFLELPESGKVVQFMQ